MLIGHKYAYVNDYFYNLDSPRSGLKKLKAISKPFEGISLAYYYTARTWKNEHTLNIPTSPDADIQLLMTRILSLNNGLSYFILKLF